MSRVMLIACAKDKAASPAPARELYRSDVFRKARDLAERRGAPWFVLSAKYGVVQPDTVLEPYDVTLVHATRAALAEWNALVLEQLEHLGVLRQPLEILAGRCYRGWAAQPGLDVSVPMAGLQIGQMKAWLAEQLRRQA